MPSLFRFFVLSRSFPAGFHVPAWESCWPSLFRACATLPRRRAQGRTVRPVLCGPEIQCVAEDADRRDRRFRRRQEAFGRRRNRRRAVFRAVVGQVKADFDDAYTFQVVSEGGVLTVGQRGAGGRQLAGSDKKEAPARSSSRPTDGTRCNSTITAEASEAAVRLSYRANSLPWRSSPRPTLRPRPGRASRTPTPTWPPDFLELVTERVRGKEREEYDEKMELSVRADLLHPERPGGLLEARTGPTPWSRPRWKRRSRASTARP